MKYRNYRLALMGCTAIAALLLGAAAEAQEAGNASAGSTLETIVVKTTTKTARQKLQNAATDTPLASQTSGDTLRKKDIGSIQDLGRTTEPGVDWVKNEGGLFIRGLGGARVTTLIDGIPIPFLSNDARSGAGPTSTTNAQGGGDSFDFSSLSSLDVLRGADSSRVGPGALAGALVLRTLEPEDLIPAGRNWGGIAKTTFDSADRSFGGSVAVAKRIGDTSVLFQGGYKKGHERDNNGDAGGIGAVRTKANPADYDQNNLLFKLKRDLAGGHSIGFTAERFDRDVDTDLKTLQGATSGSSRVYKTGNYWGQDDTRRERISANYAYESESTDSFINSANLTLYLQRLTKNAGSSGERVGTVAGPWLRDNELQERSIGVSGAVRSSTFETGALKHEITLGGDLSFFRSTSFLTGIDACTLGTASPIAQLYSCPALHSNQSDMPDVNGTRLGLYVEDHIAFGNSGFALTPGVRFDWYDYNTKASAGYTSNSGYGSFGLPDGSDGNRFSPKLLATYDLNPGIQLFAQWSMAYRAPTVSELYLNFANPAQGYAVIGNADLKPETANGFEIGANLGDEDFGGKVTLFHNRYRNFIDTETTVSAGFPFGVTQNFNRDKVEISGVEFNAHKKFDSGFNVHAGLAYAYGKDTGSDEYLRSVAPFKSVVGVGYEQASWGTDFSMIASAGMRDDGNASTFDAPGYGIFDLTAWWEPEQIKGLRVQGGVYNVFDKTYYNAIALRNVNMSSVPSDTNSAQFQEYFSEPGRTFKISLTKKF
ncbi:TonB-dependent hemoglobin/transferrin/lactoferrin family receptor [Allorhizobium borbori]|uniref:Hemoglobin/transferrin/lactoferrin receptor protein n=1 Tax=Allorhizobium borbori TaxID=485907 RepID=A0A7W6K3T0_9HYPH|nr:TonB-dependent hemoglobin/transferrin/lactoferrin family receptor [Allorhizobium borbori]MBB4104696.1 hemoglobin/transferrin/lactoferrin receptor protein [Allorhizobium borbori]